nr:hypothetical protein [Tanacetum cinerariifolium]
VDDEEIDSQSDEDLNEVVNMLGKIVFDETNADKNDALDYVVNKMSKKGSMAIASSSKLSFKMKKSHSKVIVHGFKNTKGHSGLEKLKIKIKKALEGLSRVGSFPMRDVLVDEEEVAENSPMEMLDNEDVLIRYKNFKNFDTVADYSDHFFSNISPMEQPSNDWTRKIQADWRIFKEQLPETIHVRAYKSRIDLLRAAIVGAKGTPYHDGLFFFDVCFPSTYPISPPLVRYHSGGLCINPNLDKSGEIHLSLFKISGLQEEDIWVPGTSNILQLLISIQSLILNSHPIFNERRYSLLGGYGSEERYSLLYNENTILNSLKTMVHTMNKPPKNFKDLVAGHFCNRAHDILMACKAYTEGIQFGCLHLRENGNKEACSIKFKNDVTSYIKRLVDAFNKIGAKEAIEVVRSAHIDVKIISSISPLPTHAEYNSRIDRLREEVTNLRVRHLSIEHVKMDKDGANTKPMKYLDNEDVLKRYKKFKKFDIVTDHSDHLFSANTSPMKQPPKDWAEKIQNEWRKLEERLPETIYVRVYEGRMDLLRAVIIGEKRTPYHDGLFFFDVCFPSTYPISPPLVRYHSCGLGINPNLYKCGKVRLSVPETSGGPEVAMWLPSASTILKLLVSVQTLILNTKPLFNDVTYVKHNYMYMLYNEMTFVRSLKTMVYIMNKPPKNFEELVVGHFRNHVRNILMACKAYMEDVQVGCIVSGAQEGANKGRCGGYSFKKGLVSCIKPLVDAFDKIGADEAQQFLYLREKLILPRSYSRAPSYSQAPDKKKARFGYAYPSTTLSYQNHNNTNNHQLLAEQQNLKNINDQLLSAQLNRMNVNSQIRVAQRNLMNTQLQLAQEELKNINIQDN